MKGMDRASAEEKWRKNGENRIPEARLEKNWISELNALNDCFLFLL